MITKDDLATQLHMLANMSSVVTSIPDEGNIKHLKEEIVASRKILACYAEQKELEDHGREEPR